jgi:hypothetical protein
MKTHKTICRAVAAAAVAGCCLAGLNALAANSTAGSPASATPGKITSAPVATQSLANEDIRDIRGPYHIPPGWLWLAWVAGGLALAGLGYGAWRWHHRLGLRVKLPYEIALEQLEAARRLMQPEQARAFSIAVSEIVRDYIETRFAVRAAHRTTEEFFRDLATQPNSPLMTHQPVLADFLKHCDLAKFARWILSVPQMEAMLQSASTFIVATGKPVADLSPVHSNGTIPPTPSPGASAVAPVFIPSTPGAVSSTATTLNSQSL